MSAREAEKAREWMSKREWREHVDTIVSWGVGFLGANSGRRCPREALRGRVGILLECDPYATPAALWQANRITPNSPTPYARANGPSSTALHCLSHIAAGFTGLPVSPRRRPRTGTGSTPRPENYHKDLPFPHSGGLYTRSRHCRPFAPPPSTSTPPFQHMFVLCPARAPHAHFPNPYL